MTLKRRQNIYKKVTVDGNKELDYLSGNFVRMDIDDYKTYRIPSYMSRRPDLISNKHYGNPHYGWLIMEFNDIFDPWDELTTGKIIKIPSLKKYYNFYNKNKQRGDD